MPAFRCRLVGWLWRKPTTGSLPAGDVADTVASTDSVAHIVTGAVLDLCRSKQQLMIENALLRQQFIVLRRQVNRPRLNNADRVLLVLLAGRLGAWKSALLIVQPDT